MQFASFTFLFFFLPITMGIYYLTPRRWKREVMLGISILFLFCGGWMAALTELVLAALTYGAGLLLEKLRSKKALSRLTLAGTLLVQFGALIVLRSDWLYSLKAGAFHGSALFPIACYEEDLKSYSVAWHWHEEFEYILAVKGPLAVDVSKARLVLQTGQGVFVNSGVFHAVEQAETGDALLHSGVFHPRLIGGMGTIFWQKLVHPLLQPGAPAFFLLDEADDGQKAVLCHLREVWDAVAQEVFDYENQARYHLSAAVHLLGMQCEGGKTKVSQQEQIAAQRMKQMLRFVEEHYAEELNVERISDCVALSESACLRSFRQMLGITPIQYVKQFRVEKAAELLRSTRLKTGEIGMECGFADGSYFIKTFREIKHCTPVSYTHLRAHET